MEIKTSDFMSKYVGANIICDNDSGVCLVQYEPQAPFEKPRFEEGYNYSWNTGEKCFQLTCKIPPARKVLRSATIVRTSANCYRVMYADKNGCEVGQFKNLSELHDFLLPLWRRKLK